MSLQLVTPTISTNVPGAYASYTVQSNPSGFGTSGVIVIFGEADAGPSYSQLLVKNNFFTPNQVTKVTQKYQSGPIVDAFRMLSSPSADANITGTANQIFIAKTNTSLQASAIVDTNYGTLEDINGGILGNQDKYQIIATAAEVTPAVVGAVVPTFGAALNGASFTVRINGGAANVITLSGTSGDHDTIAHLVTELSGYLSPLGVTTAQVGATNAFSLALAADVNANRQGFGKSLELNDSTPGDLAALGLSAGLSVSSQEPAVEISDANVQTGSQEQLDAAATVALQIGYAGTTATLSIANGVLTTTKTGGTGGALSIVLSQYTTVGALATFINLQPGYSAAATPAGSQLPTAALDNVTAVNICSSGAGLMPGRIKAAAYNFQKAMATSSLLGFTPTALLGLPNVMANAVFLAGGTRGATLAADVVNVLAQLAGLNVNIVVPLFSEDASKDALLGVTDPNSTYTIEAINALVKSHCLAESVPVLKKNRIAVLSLLDTFANAQTAAHTLATFRCSLVFQSVQQVNAVGNVVTFQPWMAAVVAAGMQAGGFYQSITNKYANVISLVNPADFDDGDPGDVGEGLSAGLMMLTQDVGGIKWVSDQTSWGQDSSFVYNAQQAVYAADLIALDLAQSFQVAFVGRSLADISAGGMLAFLAQKMAQYLQLKLIGPSSDAPLGFKNPLVIIKAPEADVSVDIKLATALYFIPISFQISAIQQSA